MLRAETMLCFGTASVPSRLSLTASSASAQTYPSQTIRIIVGFGPASSADILARPLARQMEQKFKQTVVVGFQDGTEAEVPLEALTWEGRPHVKPL